MTETFAFGIYIEGNDTTLVSALAREEMTDRERDTFPQLGSPRFQQHEYVTVFHVNRAVSQSNEEGERVRTPNEQAVWAAHQIEQVLSGHTDPLSDPPCLIVDEATGHRNAERIAECLPAVNTTQIRVIVTRPGMTPPSNPMHEVVTLNALVERIETLANSRLFYVPTVDSHNFEMQLNAIRLGRHVPRTSLAIALGLSVLRDIFTPTWR